MMSPLELTFGICVCLALLCFIFSYIVDNYSFVDKLWSITPVIYTWIYWSYGLVLGAKNIFRLSVFAALITMWGLRLTANFYRKGGYNWKGEDYRWEYVKKRMGNSRSFKFQMFNLGFISLFQHLLLWALTIPVYCSLNPLHIKWGSLDTFATVWVLFFWGIELVADGQQFAFQTKKKEYLQKDPSLISKQFITDGLFRFCRHPNFTAEQAIWLGIALLGHTSSQSVPILHIPILSFVRPHWYGAILLVLLFQKSTEFTEEITLSRYPEYSKYQDTTGCFIPNLSALFCGLQKFKSTKVN